MAKIIEDLQKERNNANNNMLRFDGRIKWRKGSNVIQWSSRNENAEAGTTIEHIAKAVFGDGNAAPTISAALSCSYLEARGRDWPSLNWSSRLSWTSGRH
jgi:hypothetical protein